MQIGCAEAEIRNLKEDLHTKIFPILFKPYSRVAKNTVMYRLAHEKKIDGFTPNLDFNPLPTRFNFTPNFCLQGCIQRVCSTSREKRTSKHGISIVLKLVSIEYRCISGSCVARGKQTFQGSLYTTPSRRRPH